MKTTSITNAKHSENEKLSTLCKCYQLPYHDKFMEECKCECHQQPQEVAECKYGFKDCNEKEGYCPACQEDMSFRNCGEFKQKGLVGTCLCGKPIKEFTPEENKEFEKDVEKMKEEVADWEKTIIPEYSNIAEVNEDCVDGYEMVKAVPFITKTLEQEREKLIEWFKENSYQGYSGMIVDLSDIINKLKSK